MDNIDRDPIKTLIGRWFFEHMPEGLAERFYGPSRKELIAEIRRLTAKCAERGDENLLLRTKLEALTMEIAQAQREYRLVRRDTPQRILDGKRADAVHAERIEYENNRLRVFASATHRMATEIINSVAHLNKDLGRAKQAVVGGMMGPGGENPPG